MFGDTPEKDAPAHFEEHKIEVVNEVPKAIPSTEDVIEGAKASLAESAIQP